MIKKALISFFCAFFALIAYGYNFKSGGLYYTITSSTNMTVEVSYNSNDRYTNGVYAIPNQVTYNGKTYYVTGIGSYAFSGCTALTTITFDEHTYVKTIKDHAFSGCNAMSRITIPANVTSIGNYAFSGCFTLKFVTIEDATATLSLGYGSKDGSNYGLFADTDLRSFYWGRPLSYNTNYGRSPIANLSNLSEITIGPNVSTISPYMFSGNVAIKSIELPATVTSLGEHAFHGFKGLTSFTIPQQITTIGDYAFAYCTGLTSLTIPKWITTIGKGAFSGCTGFKSFVIPNSVKSIGNLAFSGCTSLTGVVFEEGDETLKLGYNEYNGNGTGKGMFYDCPLQSVFIGRPLNYSYYIYGSYSYNDYPGRFGWSPFANNTTLTKAHFGNPVKSIQLYLFAGCTSLTTLQYNSKCKPTSIGKYAFWSCKSLTEKGIVYPKSVKTIGDGAFKNCTSLEGYTIPNHITTVGNYAFQNCEKLASVVVKPSVTSIGSGTFIGCTSLTGVVFEEGDETLKLGYNEYNSNGTGKGMFYDCPLQSVFIGRPLNYSYYIYGSYSYNDYPGRFGWSPFANNTTLTKAHFGNPVKSIQLYLFAGCTSLTTLQYNSKCKPTSIGKYAFWSCKGLTSIDIPATVTTIGVGAFRNCENFTKFDMPQSLATIGSNAFENCSKLREIVIPNKMSTIDKYVFSGCSALVNVVIPETITSIGEYAFHNCSSLTDFSCYPLKAPIVKTNTFTDTPIENVTLHVPAASVDAYQYAPWINFKKIVKMVGPKVKLSKTKAAIQKGKTLTLKATVTPSDLSDKSVTWMSSDTKVATVTSTGKVKGVKAGTATITCTSKATGANAICKVTVGYVKLDQTEVSVKKGKTVTLTATVYPSKLTDKSVTWTSSNTKVATVTSAGKVKGVKAGTATITCTSNATGLSTTCIVTVTGLASTRSMDGDDVEVTGIEENAVVVEPFDVYDLSGRKVLHQVTSLDGLPNGIYIVNGKKVLKKQ